MKKIFLTFATAALLSVNVFAADGGKKATEGATVVSYTVQQAFAADFADAANVSWSETKSCVKADFVADGAKKTAFYSFTGDFLGTTQTVGYNAIPAKSQKLIADTYKDFTPASVIVYQANTNLNDNIDATTYFVDLKNTNHEILVRVTSTGSLDFFKQVK